MQANAFVLGNCPRRGASKNPANNNFLLASQFSVTGALYTCRPDLIGFVTSDEPLTLGEILPARDDDPATQVCRRLDWEDLIRQLDEMAKAILFCLATCQELTILVKRFGKSRSMIQNHKDRLGRLVKEHMGEDILLQVQERPGWCNDLHVNRERLACRREQSTI